MFEDIRILACVDAASRQLVLLMFLFNLRCGSNRLYNSRSSRLLCPDVRRAVSSFATLYLNTLRGAPTHEGCTLRPPVLPSSNKRRNSELLVHNNTLETQRHLLQLHRRNTRHRCRNSPHKRPPTGYPFGPGHHFN